MKYVSSNNHIMHVVDKKVLIPQLGKLLINYTSDLY